jgi:hypothetical protein
MCEAHPDVQASVHDDGLVLLHAGRGRVFSANVVGARIWQGVLGGQTANCVAESLSREFHVPAEQALCDTTAFLGQLERAGLLVRRSSS